MKLKTYNNFLKEGLATKEIDPKQFPNPNKDNPTFFVDGKKDGQMTDDVVHTKFIGIPAKQLKPSQDAVYLGKALGMAINGVVGGDLGAVISKDNRILDGHHRWAATIFNDPNAKVNGVKAELSIGDLIPVLRAAGDALGNNRGLPPEGGDINIFKATVEDVKKCCYEGLYMDLKYFDKQKAIEWFESKGETEIKKALAIINRVGPPAGAPHRQDMPKIKPNQVDKVANDLNSGKIDVRKPYNESLMPTFNQFLGESYKGDPDIELEKRGKDYDVAYILGPIEINGTLTIDKQSKRWKMIPEFADKQAEKYWDDNWEDIEDEVIKKLEETK